MAFLVPALVALACDIAVLYLHRLGKLDNNNSNSHNYNDSSSGNYSNPQSEYDVYNDNNEAGDETQVYFWIGYLAPLAVVRILLLLLPLFFHSYTGTALRFPRLYTFLYGSSLLLLLAHMLALLLLNPASLESIFPYDGYLTTTTSSNNGNSSKRLLFIAQYDEEDDQHQHYSGQRHQHRFLLQHLHALRRIWWMLVFSTLSNVCHLILLQHVKSTAPQNDLLGGKQPHSIYFAIRTRGKRKRRQQRKNNKPLKHHDSDEEIDNDDYQYEDAEQDEDFLEDEEEPAVIQAVNDFLVDVQGHLRRTKIEWSKRLDDFSRRMQEGGASARSLSGNNNNNSNPNGSPVVTRSKASGSSTPAGTNNITTISPFKVLLQLFADQDNAIFGKLSAAFDLDQGQTMTFYVPQLLSFLLHGATTSSEELEEWILARCVEDVQFAHRCYWFLRAWCLEVPGETSAAAAAAILSRQNSETQLAALEQHQQQHDIQQQQQLFLDQPALETFQQSSPKSGTLCLPSTDGKNSKVNALAALSDDKFLPAERAMIERLMLRVKECGESSARILEYGGSVNIVQGSSAHVQELQQSRTVAGAMSPSTMMQVVEMGALPIDPTTGRPSQRHLDCMAANQKYGFLPFSQVMTPSQQSPPGLAPSGSMNTLPADSTEQFDKTPQFLDSLIFIAETLFHVPRESRKEELKNMLRQLECELLPDNAVYVPSRRQPQGILGRVWRVAVPECIAISTKERVPCIIPLEVILMDQDGDSPPPDPSLLTSRTSLNDLRAQYRNRGSFSILDHLPKSFLSSSSVVANNPTGSSNPPLSPDEALALPGSLDSVREEANTEVTLSPRAGGEVEGGSIMQQKKSSSAPAEASEADIVNEWRNRARNPHRLVPLINKVAESMKGTMDHMKVSVQKSLNHLRDRAVSEELASLTANVDGSRQTESPSSVTKLIPASDERDEEGVSNDENDVEMNGKSGKSSSGTPSKPSHDRSSPALPPLPPKDADPPSLPMGQWSSPSPSSSRKVISTTLRRRSEAQGGAGEVPASSSGNENDGESSLALPYGSGGEKKYKGKKAPKDSGLPPLPSDPKRGHRRTGSSGNPGAAPKPAVVFKESWQVKQERVRQNSAYGNHPGWRLYPILIKANDDLRQEELASQLIYRMASILAREKVPVWLCPYDIIALTDTGGMIEAIPDTISIDSLKKNDPDFTNLRDFFTNHYGEGTPELSDAKANFVESLAAYSMVCFLLQIKDRHNGNILVDSVGHVIHIDFGFFFLSSPGKNAGFESAPFKLTRDFVDVMDGPHSHLFHIFRELCVRSFLALRKHCLEIILLVEMLKNGNEQLKCFRGRPNDAIEGLRDRFRLDLNDRACREYIHSLIDDSIENWRTDWYDRYQRYFVGVL